MRKVCIWPDGPGYRSGSAASEKTQSVVELWVKELTYWLILQ